jgi:diadenosine tetraphosphate (Ap4A) HIT family hydrolase
MANETLLNFGYPSNLIREYQHWAVLFRPAQVTLGSLVLIARSEAVAFGQLPADAFAELAVVTKEIEGTLGSEVAYEKINYLMLMMVDPNVHFHVFPRYSGTRTIDDVTIADAGWPGPPDLKSAPDLSPEMLTKLRQRISENWLICS